MKPTVIIPILFSSVTAVAKPIPEVQKFLTDELVKIASSMEQFPGDQPLEPGLYPGQSEFVFDTFALRIQAQVGFSAPGIGSLTLVPDVELFWRR